MNPISVMKETMNCAASHAFRECRNEISALQMIFGKVLSEPRDPSLKYKILRIDDTALDQLEFLHDLYNNPAEHGVDLPKVRFQQVMRDSYEQLKDRFYWISNDMLSHDNGVKPKVFGNPLLAGMPAVAAPIRSVGPEQVSIPSYSLNKPAAAEPPVATLAGPEKKEIDEDEDMVCPITGEVMKDPWVDPEGNSFEKSAIFEWLNKNKSSPITRKALSPEQLAPNRALKNLIEKKYSK